MKLSVVPTTHPLIKAFYLGTQGQGKSGSTVPLAISGPIRGLPRPGEGFELRVLDFDGKYEEIARAVLHTMYAPEPPKKPLISKAQHDEALNRIDLCVCREKTGIIKTTVQRKMASKIGIKGASSAWTTAVNQLDKWMNSFTPNHILIIDSLTHAAKVAANYSQELHGRFNQELTWKEFQEPQQLVANLMTFAADCPAHTIVCGHQTTHELYRKTTELDDEGKPIEELVDTFIVPVSVGKAGSLELPSQFNHCLVAAEEGKGRSISRYLHARPIKGVMTKSPFFNAKARYPIETGWVEYFALRKSKN